MRFLFVTQAYPSEEDVYTMAFVHTRALEYVRRGLEVDVLSFSAQESYRHEGIFVTPNLSDVRKRDYRAVIAHAPNIRNHVRILSRLNPRNLTLVFHGHEALIKRRYYPEPYPYMRPRAYPLALAVDALYDSVKLKLLAGFIRSRLSSLPIKCIFVSEWLRERFHACSGLDAAMLEPHSTVVPNPVAPVFIDGTYDPGGKKVADFITIRPFDDAKYAIDEVVMAAQANPRLRFHLFGKGRYFNFHEAPPNLVVEQRFFRHEEMPQLLSRYRAALMPTRQDTQGVTMCEMATFGIPLVVSDIRICHDMLDGYGNVAYLKRCDVSLSGFLNSAVSDTAPDKVRYNAASTVGREFDFVCGNLH